MRVLREADRCKAPGAVGALLRREGLYSSLLTEWRRQRERSARAGLSATRRGPRVRPVDPRLKHLEQENAKLRRRLQRAEAMIAIQNKCSEMLGIPLNPLDDDGND
jgi:transposase-like protein